MAHSHDHDHGHKHHGHEHHHDQGHEHGARHAHAGHHHVHVPASFGRAFAVGIALNTSYVLAEALYGLSANSLALLADAGHNFGDVLSLAVAWLASWLARRAPTERYTYGLRGSSILAALGNAVVLLVVTGGIAWAAVLRLMHPAPAGGVVMMAVAACGVVVNGFTALMFASGRKGDLNIRSAFAHMASDALVALGVVVSGGAILLTGWSWLDPVVSLLIGGMIVLGTWSLMRESLDLAIQAVPTTIDRAEVLGYLKGLPGVSDVHDLHIWGMSTTETALTAHLVRPGAELDDSLLHRVCSELRARFAIHHTTLQVETGQANQPCALAPLEVV